MAIIQHVHGKIRGERWVDRIDSEPVPARVALDAATFTNWDKDYAFHRVTRLWIRVGHGGEFVFKTLFRMSPRARADVSSIGDPSGFDVNGRFDESDNRIELTDKQLREMGLHGYTLLKEMIVAAYSGEVTPLQGVVVG